MSLLLHTLIATAGDQEVIKLDRWLICIGFLQLAGFAFQAWMLQRTVAGATEASKDMKRSIDQATRAADAMEKSAKAATIASENVVIVTERTAQQIRAYLSVTIGTGVYQDAQCQFEVKPVLTNTGQSPAHKVKYIAKADILPLPLPTDFVVPNP